MKIAIVAYYFKPDEVVGAVRPESWANWLSYDHNVSVITPKKNKYVELEEGYHLVQVESFAVKLLELLNSIRKQIRSKATRLFRPASKNKRIPSFAFSYRMPCLHDAWFFSCFFALLRLKPDLIIATHSPYINLVAGWVYKVFFPRTLLWSDYRDLWTQNHTSSGLPIIRNFERVLEVSILKKSDIVTTVSNFLSDNLSTNSGKTVYCIYNCAKHFSYHETEDYFSRRKINICYVGTIWAKWRDPSGLFLLIKKLIDSGVVKKENFSMCLASRNPGDFLALSEDYGLRDLIDFRGGVSRNDACKIQQDADILLLLESNAPEARGVLTGKVFEYLLTDKPILLVGPGPDSELYQLLQKHDRLFTLDDLERFLRGEMKTLPKGIPVDYSEISRSQLLAVMEELKFRAARVSEN